MKEFLTNHIDSIIAYILGAGGLIDAWRERRKRQADALSSMQNSYDKFVEDYDRKFEAMRTDMISMEKKHVDEINKLEDKLEKVEKHWRQKYNSLKLAFDNYKKAHP